VERQVGSTLRTKAEPHQKGAQTVAKNSPAWYETVAAEPGKIVWAVLLAVEQLDSYI
jgi:hypothetical protein